MSITIGQSKKTNTATTINQSADVIINALRSKSFYSHFNRLGGLSNFFLDDIWYIIIQFSLTVLVFWIAVKFETRSGISTGLEVLESNLAHDSFYPLLLSLFFVVVMSGLSMGMSSSSYSAFSHSPLLKVCITGDWWWLSCLLDRQEILAKDDNSLKKQDEHLPPEQQTADDNSLKKDGTQIWVGPMRLLSLSFSVAYPRLISSTVPVSLVQSVPSVFIQAPMSSRLMRGLQENKLLRACVQ